MSQSSQEREEKIAKAYHSETGLKNAAGIDVGPGGDKIVAGEDDRKDYFNVDDAQKKLADATVILTDKSDLTKQPDGSFKLDVDPFRQRHPISRQSLPPCSGERFASQHTGGWCSGFMVGPDVIVTAGHCGQTNAEIQQTAYVFGFRVGSADDPGTTNFSADQVYFGKELIAHDLSPTGDFAIVRVDREITAAGAVPVKVRKTGSISVGENIGVIGYPSGLPVKIAFGEQTVLMQDQDPWLIANLDTYGGNSGSAVFTPDGTVEGILVRGAQDYEFDDGNGCFRSNEIKNAQGSEAVTKSSVFVDRIPDAAD